MESIRRKSEFLRVTREGSRITAPPLLARVLKTGSGESLRLGITIPKRFGKSVIRNRVRRRIREAMSQAESTLGAQGTSGGTSGAWISVTLTGSREPTYEQVQKAIWEILEDIAKKEAS